MEHLDALAKILAVAGSFLLGIRWVVNRIESGQDKLFKGQQKLRRELAAKVDHAQCRRRRKELSRKWIKGKDLEKAS
jgi:hypothetical protein